MASAACMRNWFKSSDLEKSVQVLACVFLCCSVRVCVCVCVWVRVWEWVIVLVSWCWVIGGQKNRCIENYKETQADCMHGCTPTLRSSNKALRLKWNRSHTQTQTWAHTQSMHTNSAPFLSCFLDVSSDVFCFRCSSWACCSKTPGVVEKSKYPAIL